MLMLLSFGFIIGAASAVTLGKIPDFGDSMIQELMSQYSNRMLPLQKYNSKELHKPPNVINRVAKDYELQQFQPQVDNLILNREPSIRDQEYLEHSSLWGHRFVQGGAGEGYQRLKPDGSVKNVQVVKTDAALPAYCNPPNPCPLGYTEEDGCIEDFENSAAYSRAYQQQQQCMCDNEHMFDCPGNTEENELDAIARSLQNNAMSESNLENLVTKYRNKENSGHRVVAKKFFVKKRPSYFNGEKLPVVAKKSPQYVM